MYLPRGVRVEMGVGVGGPLKLPDRLLLAIPLEGAPRDASALTSLPAGGPPCLRHPDLWGQRLRSVISPCPPRTEQGSEAPSITCVSSTCLGRKKQHSKTAANSLTVAWRRKKKEASVSQTPLSHGPAPLSA